MVGKKEYEIYAPTIWEHIFTLLLHPTHVCIWKEAVLLLFFFFFFLLLLLLLLLLLPISLALHLRNGKRYLTHKKQTHFGSTTTTVDLRYIRNYTRT